MALGHTLRPPRPFGPVDSVLDVGCGIRPQRLVTPPRRYLGIDVHRAYIDALDDPDRFRCGDWRTELTEMADREFDMVVALDFLEHLDTRDGGDFLFEAQRVARTVVIFTPLGECPQSYEDGEPDQWGMDGGRWQTHRSAWTPDDFPGWEIHVLPGFHTADANLRPLPEPIGAFWAIKEN